MIDAAEGRGVIALSDDDLSMVSAAGNMAYDTMNPIFHADIPYVCPSTLYGEDFSGKSDNNGKSEYGGNAGYNSQNNGAELKSCSVETIESPSPTCGGIINNGGMRPENRLSN